MDRTLNTDVYKYIYIIPSKDNDRKSKTNTPSKITKIHQTYCTHSQLRKSTCEAISENT